jgi:hypothetical protein
LTRRTPAYFQVTQIPEDLETAAKKRGRAHEGL